jgi:hypothetical protein
MSHVVSVKSLLTSEAAIQRACAALAMAPAKRGTFAVYNATVTGLGFNLPEWRFPCVADLKTGELRYDNYKGAWGDTQTLDKFTQRYSLEAAKLVAEAAGETCGEEYTDTSGRICFDIETPESTHVLVGTDQGSGSGPACVL